MSKPTEEKAELLGAISTEDEATSCDEDESLDSLPENNTFNRTGGLQLGSPQEHDQECQGIKIDRRNGIENRMRRRLQFFFMNPIEKWVAKRRVPYKFIVQLIKIFLVTMQLCLFAHTRYTHVNYTWDNRITFSHLFLKGWDASREISAYPPSNGPLALYKSDEFYDTLDYANHGYEHLGSAIGTYSYASENNTLIPPKLCLFRYKQGQIFAANESYIFDSEVIENCYIWNLNDTTLVPSRDFFKNSVKEEIMFSEVILATLSFSLKTVNFKAAGRITPPDCYKFNVIIKFDNEDHDGQMKIVLDAAPIRLVCRGDTTYITSNEIDTLLRSVLNYLVIIICLISLVLCSRAIYRAQQLKVITIVFFKNFFGRTLSQEGRMEFLNMWYIMIIINDILIIVGSGMKEQIERKEFIGDRWNICSVFLGTGNMLVWFGVLRYLGFFKTYNVVILTLKESAPKVARFLICAILIYAGFTFCGWLILGPYHMKFRSLATTSECLFSLINGDDMFATFSIMSFKSPMLWWYSRIYLYSFIGLYIYVIISLFITVISDAYGTIKRYYKHGFPKTDLQKFIGKTIIEDLSSGIYCSESTENLCDILNEMCCCPKFRNTYIKYFVNNFEVQSPARRRNGGTFKTRTNNTSANSV